LTFQIEDIHRVHVRFNLLAEHLQVARKREFTRFALAILTVKIQKSVAKAPTNLPLGERKGKAIDDMTLLFILNFFFSCRRFP
jgi:hypothetical protein